MTKANKIDQFRHKAIPLALASCFSASVALANPTGGTVAGGSASLATSGSTLTVTNTPNTIINWQSFGINTGETVRFIQQSAASTVLNRVIGPDPSAILGTLQSNGRVFLINPAGITFGAGAVVDTAGLVASTLNISDADFLAGRMRFNADRLNPGSVNNAGEIRTPNGGFVYLIAPSVENSGIITTPSGEAILAAGNSVELVDSTDLRLRVKVSAQSQDVNLSQLMTQSNGNIFSVLNSGKVSANTALVGQNGKIYFKSAGNIQTTALSVVEAKGDAAADGGSIVAFADGAGIYAGKFDVSGRNGGFVETSGSYLDVNDINLSMRALDPNGKGGTWLLDPTDITIDNVSTPANGCSPTFDNCSGATSHIFVGQINTALGSGSVVINTSSAYLGNGDIILAGGISSTGPYSLQLIADRNIEINAGGSINLTNSDLWLNAADSIHINAGTISARNVQFTAFNDIVASPSVSVSALEQLHLKNTAGFMQVDAGSTISGRDVWIEDAGYLYVNGSILASANNPGMPGSNINIDTAYLSLANASTISASSSYGGAWVYINGGTLDVSGAITATSNDSATGIDTNGNNYALGYAQVSLYATGAVNLNAGSTVKATSGYAGANLYVGGNSVTIGSGGAGTLGAYASQIGNNSLDIHNASGVNFWSSGGGVSIAGRTIESSSTFGDSWISVGDSYWNGTGTASGPSSGNISITNSTLTAYSQDTSASTYNCGTYQCSGSLEGGVGIYSPGSVTIQNSTITGRGYKGYVDIEGDAALTLDTNTVNALSDASIDSGILLVSQNLNLLSSNISAMYVGLNYEPKYIQTNTVDFYNYVSTASVTLQNTTVSGSQGVGFAGNNVTLTSSSMGANATTGGCELEGGCMHGIVFGSLKLNGSSLSAQHEMLLEVGTGIYLDNYSSITVASPATLYFNFPLLASGGWFVDGVEGVFGSPGSGSYILVEGAAPIKDVNFFVSYGNQTDAADQLIKEIDNILSVDDTVSDTYLEADSNDFFGNGEESSDDSSSENGSGEGKKKKKSEPKECKA